jgi:hypothetical protein
MRQKASKTLAVLPARNTPSTLCGPRTGQGVGAGTPSQIVPDQAFQRRSRRLTENAGATRFASSESLASAIWLAASQDDERCQPITEEELSDGDSDLCCTVGRLQSYKPCDQYFHWQPETHGLAFGVPMTTVVPMAVPNPLYRPDQGVSLQLRDPEYVVVQLKEVAMGYGWCGKAGYLETLKNVMRAARYSDLGNVTYLGLLRSFWEPLYHFRTSTVTTSAIDWKQFWEEEVVSHRGFDGTTFPCSYK